MPYIRGSYNYGNACACNVAGPICDCNSQGVKEWSCICNAHSEYNGCDSNRTNFSFTGGIVRKEDINELRAAIRGEYGRRGLSYPSFLNENLSHDIITAQHVKSLREALNAMREIYWQYSIGEVDPTKIVIKAPIYETISVINDLENDCLCNCNHCPCNCNHCTCDCNYCTCHCNYCPCNCNHCPCVCEVCPCVCNHCVCNCEYSDKNLKHEIIYL